MFLDMGLYQGPRDEARRLNAYMPAAAQDADAIILSHGHLDHCGKLPVIVKHGFTGRIYCTGATADVARVVLEDSAEIQEEDAVYLNRRSRSPADPEVEPLYRRADVQQVLKQFHRVNYGQKIDLGNSVNFTFHDAGHILGSAYVLIEWLEKAQRKTLLFTADIGRYDTPILRDPAPLPGPVDHVITESTYGNRLHAPMSEIEPQFFDAVKWCVEKRSRLIVPSFAVGRTQTVLWYMQKFVDEGKIPSIPIFVDSPMGIEISRIHTQFRDYFDDQTRDLIGQRDLFGLSRVTFAKSADQSKAINGQSGACVIIASSPTCEFGRVLHHIRHSIERPNDLIVFVGWIPPQTLGRRLQEGQKRVRIYDSWYDLRCQVRTIHGLSAHADSEELLRFLKPTLRRETSAYIVHGEAESAEAFATKLLDAGMGRATVPALETAVVESA